LDIGSTVFNFKRAGQREVANHHGGIVGWRFRGVLEPTTGGR
jgi:hypothetical protein